MRAYYNEIDPFCIQWLRNLIERGLLADGIVDDRDIRTISADDLKGYSQCHFFAGLGGWGRALRLTGWPDARPVWTGSCPCQSFSAAGNREGVGDDRHLWPAWASLIKECRPPIIFGEQVASAIGYGWLDAVALDLEAQAYSVGAAVLPACAVGAPHRRDRLWFVADAQEHKERGGSQKGTQTGKRRQRSNNGSDDNVSVAGGARLALGSGAAEQWSYPAIAGSDWWAIEPDVGRVAHGIPGRVDKLRALGNAVVPQVAAEFIRAATEG